jgi:hypothetical protein
MGVVVVLPCGNIHTFFKKIYSIFSSLSNHTKYFILENSYHTMFILENSYHTMKHGNSSRAMIWHSCCEVSPVPSRSEYSSPLFPKHCHRTIQIIPIKCTNQPFKLNPQLLHSTSTPRLHAVTRIDYTGTLAKRRAQWLQAKAEFKIIYKQRLTQASEIIHNKVLQSRVTFQTSEFKHSGKYNKFETSFENTIR